MISLRYHIVSLSAAFLALAVGVVLGSTALSGPLLDSVTAENNGLNGQVSELRAERDGLRAQVLAADRFGTQVAPATLRGRLDGRGVMVVATADSDDRQREELYQLIAQAGATVSGELTLTDSLLDPDKADQLRELIPRLLPAGATLPTVAEPGTLAGVLLGRLVMTTPDGQPQATPEETQMAFSALSQGGFVRTTVRFAPAPLVVTVLGRQDGTDRAATVARLTAELDRAGAGAVLAGPTGSADGGRAVGITRADGVLSTIVSTVDNLDSVPGRITTVLALREQLDGATGHYGAAGNAQGAGPQT